MKLFGLFKNKEKNAVRFTETDRIWVEDNFKWLIDAFGYPYRENDQIFLSENYFPNTFKDDKISIENIITDLCSILRIREEKISFLVVNDIRDSYNLPYEIEGKPFETTLEIDDGIYKIIIANSLQKQHTRLIYSLVYEFIKIKLVDSKLQFDTGDDSDLFIYLAGVYFGFGVLLSQNLKDTGRIEDGLWETKWNYISEMPNEIMAFALATYSKLIEQDSPKWKDNLPSELKEEFENALKYLADNESQLFDKQELESNELFKTSYNQYLRNEFEQAIANLQKILLLTKDDVMKADAYNNLGYYNIRLKKYKESLPYFKKSIEIFPNYGYASDNLAYALIQLGELEEAKEWLDKALETENNDVAYTYRNLALYHLGKEELNKTEEYFEKAFEYMTDTVDLLEFHYAEFLFKKGETEKALEFFKIGLNKGEPEAIERMIEIKKN